MHNTMNQIAVYDGHLNLLVIFLNHEICTERLGSTNTFLA